jgi:hypothetical protein
MVVLGIRVVRADGAHAEPWRAVVRTLILPISIAFFFVSIPLILVLRAHQAPHDLVAGTAVVYAWDARAAKWRLLARGSAQQQIPGAQPSATGDAVQAGQPRMTGEEKQLSAVRPSKHPKGSDHDHARRC